MFLGINVGMRYKKTKLPKREPHTRTYDSGVRDGLQELGGMRLFVFWGSADALWIVGSRASILDAFAESVTEPQLGLWGKHGLYVTVFKQKKSDEIIVGIRNDGAELVNQGKKGSKVKDMFSDEKYEAFFLEQLPPGKHGVLDGDKVYSLHPGQLSVAVKNLFEENNIR